jgi:hypothetical protein
LQRCAGFVVALYSNIVRCAPENGGACAFRTVRVTKNFDGSEHEYLKREKRDRYVVRKRAR